ncbi:hypothetical protein LWI29_014912 [Acer saccharum]|uniref:Retrotransposon Copia-like N-terminal domain-containing protein n=1 Tax=Acer saccharum TaxID=4024 RepID=A0AA39TMB1_ACESA|nr:hypothetical protein LWI29_014912 [Acer saccharum]
MSNDSKDGTSGSKPSKLDSHSGSGGSDQNSSHHNLFITSHKLTGKNYLQWSKFVLIFIRGKGKDDYLSGTIDKPAKEDTGYLQEIWDATKETFSISDNTTELFVVEGILHGLRQGDDSVTSYFTKLSRLWQQVDTLENDKFKNPKDEITHKKSIEKKRIFKFLFGLNRNFDDVRGRVMAIKPLRTLREAFSKVV